MAAASLPPRKAGESGIAGGRGADGGDSPSLPVAAVGSAQAARPREGAAPARSAVGRAAVKRPRGGDARAVERVDPGSGGAGDPRNGARLPSPVDGGASAPDAGAGRGGSPPPRSGDGGAPADVPAGPGPRSSGASLSAEAGGSPAGGAGDGGGATDTVRPGSVRADAGVRRQQKGRKGVGPGDVPSAPPSGEVVPAQASAGPGPRSPGVSLSAKAGGSPGGGAGRREEGGRSRGAGGEEHPPCECGGVCREDPSCAEWRSLKAASEWYVARVRERGLTGVGPPGWLPGGPTEQRIWVVLRPRPRTRREEIERERAHHLLEWWSGGVSGLRGEEALADLRAIVEENDEEWTPELEGELRLLLGM